MNSPEVTGNACRFSRKRARARGKSGPLSSNLWVCHAVGVGYQGLGYRHRGQAPH